MRKLLLKCGYSAGDIVMLTAAVRDLHRKYPGKFVTDVRTPFPAIWKHNPHITPVDERDDGVEIIDCHYPLIHHSNNVPVHCLNGFSSFLSGRLGLNIPLTDFKGAVYLSEPEKSWM